VEACANPRAGGQSGSLLERRGQAWGSNPQHTAHAQHSAQVTAHRARRTTKRRSTTARAGQGTSAPAKTQIDLSQTFEVRQRTVQSSATGTRSHSRSLAYLCCYFWGFARRCGPRCLGDPMPAGGRTATGGCRPVRTLSGQGPGDRPTSEQAARELTAILGSVPDPASVPLVVDLDTRPLGRWYSSAG
jgi:hypothetical protein